MTTGLSKLEIVRGNEALDISDELNYVHEENDGFGMAALHRLWERGPLQHGATDLGYRLDARMISLVVGVLADSWASHYARRQELLGYLSPTNDAAIKLRFTLPDGTTVRVIDGYCVSGPWFGSRDMVSKGYIKAGFQVWCPEGAWYDPERKSIRAVGTGGVSGFTFPMAVPWMFGGVEMDQTLDVPYAGSFHEYPEIEITGPVVNPKVENLDTGEMIELAATLAGGEVYTMDLRYGYKTVVDGSGNNKISEVTSGSDLATWHLQPGDNSVRVTGQQADTATSVMIRYYERYLGI